MHYKKAFTEELVSKYFLDFDVTNYSELVGMATIIIINSLLIFKILFNFKSIYLWVQNN